MKEVNVPSVDECETIMPLPQFVKPAFQEVLLVKGKSFHGIDDQLSILNELLSPEAQLLGQLPQFLNIKVVGGNCVLVEHMLDSQ